MAGTDWTPSSEDLTDALARDVSGAGSSRVEVLRKQKADRPGAHPAGMERGRKERGAAHRGVRERPPSQMPTRVLNSTFGLCATEVRFYNEVYRMCRG